MCCTRIFRNYAVFVSASHSPINHRLRRLVLINTHIYERNMDVTSILMMDVCKWTSFAWCVTDGLRDEKHLSEDQKLRKIKSLPSFLEFFSYIFFFAGCIAGVYEDIHIFYSLPTTSMNSMSSWTRRGCIPLCHQQKPPPWRLLD